MYNSIELFYEPRNIIQYLSEPYVEMSKNDHGVLCGLIKEYNPKKIVEIGVAGGGTTSVVMNCLYQINSDAKMYSIDISEMCYRRSDKKTGYLFGELENRLPNYHNHSFFLGKVSPEVIDKIGEDIDFLILDTVHSMPGEFLDFLAVLPHLRNGAVVVLHDVVLNLQECDINGLSYTNRLLLSCVSSNCKFYNFETLSTNELPNIGAFIVDEKTKEDVLNVFQSMSITWSYIPKKEMLDEYMKYYKYYYSQECIDVFSRILYFQNKKKWGYEAEKENEQLSQAVKKGCYLYGAGIIGSRINKYIKKNGGVIKGFVVSDEININAFQDMQEVIIHLSDYLCRYREYALILTTKAMAVKENLDTNGVEYLSLSNDFLRWIEYCEQKEEWN